MEEGGNIGNKASQNTRKRGEKQTNKKKRIAKIKQINENWIDKKMS